MALSPQALLVSAALGALGRRNLVLVGFMGTGKSSLGRAAASALGRPFRDTDGAVQERAGCPIPEVFARWGEVRFREWEAEAVSALGRASALVLATGGGVLARPENVTALRAGGLLVALRARPEVILHRVGGAEAARTRPLLAGGDPLARIRSLLAAREPMYAGADASLDTSDLTLEAAVRALLRVVVATGSAC